MDFHLAGKTAVIAASSQGLGYAIAEQLVKEGANVVISGRDEDKLQQKIRELSKCGPGKSVYQRADMTNPEDINQLVTKAVESFGGIQILVNNAGGPPAGLFEDFSDDDWQAAFQLNLLSYIRLIRAALPYLKQQGGKILNIASGSVKEPIPGLILSNTFRTGIVGLAKTLAGEFAPYDILINTIAPGRISTDRIKQLDQVRAEREGTDMERIAQEKKAAIPLKRYGTPEEFAKVAVFLLSGANTYMTGSTLFVDGGMIKSI